MVASMISQILPRYMNGWIFIIFLIISCSEKPAYENIYGVWRGNYNDKEMMFRFNSNGTCLLHIKNTIIDSTEIINGTFEIDFLKTPISLSVRNIPQTSHPLYTIIEFINYDSIKIANFSPRWKLRPISFNQNTNMNLKRVKENE
jgi:hypothetical protein